MFIAHRTLNAREADNRHDEDDDAEITLLLVRSTTDNQMFITNNSKPKNEVGRIGYFRLLTYLY